MTVNVMFYKTKTLWDKRVDYQRKPGVKLLQIHVSCKALNNYIGST